jgi:restriction system protein
MISITLPLLDIGFLGAVVIIIGAIFFLFIIFGFFIESNENNRIEREKKMTQYYEALNNIREYSKKIIDSYSELIEEIADISSTDNIDNIRKEDESEQTIPRLQSILKNNYEHNEEKIWKSLIDNSEFKDKNLIEDINLKIKKAEKLELNFKQIKQDKESYFITERRFLTNKENFPSYEDIYLTTQQNIDRKKNSFKKKYIEVKEKWDLRFEEFEKAKKLNNQLVEIIKDKYYQNDKEGIELYYSKVIKSVTYHINFQKEIKADFNPKNNVLIIEYLLPSIDNFPRVKKRQYLKTRFETRITYYNDREINTLYEDITYIIVLDLLKKIFVYDYINQVKTVVFNGWSKSINKATGLINEACILSVSTNKDEFLKINLPEVDPKECFKGLKGISAHKISNLTPIKPIITINQNDKRFVSAHNVEVDSSTNLASMNWEDFEHLIREIFEKEFTSNGGNVKVTQSSRDGGVDAIAFDPDPIRGGKIVIQAKRYTNVVGVSAVRDLYGTVLNEGATKGILVTTSDYGSDSYNFAKDKPITLLNGSNLLHLLEKHNYKARINIKEAREEINNF